MPTSPKILASGVVPHASGVPVRKPGKNRDLNIFAKQLVVALGYIFPCSLLS